ASRDGRIGAPRNGRHGGPRGPRQAGGGGGGGIVERPERVIGERLQGGLGIGGIAVYPDGGRCLREQVLYHPDIRLAVNVVENQRQVAAGRQLGIPQHVPQRGPGDGAGERVGELGEVICRGRE